ncbi:MAG TPA: hypothetical protein VKH19_18835 [Gemmatimonadaceae bacterium]|nr:hypothetical protein [Gemmatimonadaceae bacterium]
MRLSTLPAIAVALAGLASSAAGQNEGDTRAAVALQSTPLGAFAPLMSPSMIMRRLNGAQLGLRYGLKYDNNVNAQAVAANVTWVAGLQSSITLNAGVLDADCSACAPALLLGAGADMRIAEFGDAAGDASQLTISVGGDMGYAQLKPGNDYALALGVSAPVTLSLGSGGRDGLRFVPYFTPTFGVGETSTACQPVSCSRNGTRFMFGGGLGVWNPTSNLSASIGISQVMISGAQAVYGVNVAFGGK